uniref:SxtE n=1 Tax=Microseira wollei TaxID=467598 RepID=D1FNQ2_9CYAN|nr:SxtE [Microseira wollei]
MLKAINRFFIRTLAFVFAFGIFLTTGVGIAKADYLVQGGKITNVQNTSSNGDNYAVTISGGVGPCADRVIILPASGVLNRDIHARGYKAVLTALSNGFLVDIYDYTGSSCSNGGQVTITK